MTKQIILDEECLDCCDLNLNMLVPWYLMASYAYYVEDNPILTDQVFDRLGRKMLNHWEDIDHFHKDRLSKDMLEAGTYLGNYPSRVSGGLDSLRKIYTNTKKFEKRKKKSSEGGLLSFM